MVTPSTQGNGPWPALLLKGRFMTTRKHVTLDGLENSQPGYAVICKIAGAGDSDGEWIPYVASYTMVTILMNGWGNRIGAMESRYIRPFLSGFTQKLPATLRQSI
ncbi:MAG: hypothetical protein Ct9H300mP19_18280 [Dehalococcoidia bacterium]|nr:MAG: hypothetical protein Ct9H300mP19_18280 [Dehalococcoidia bacterium]